MTPTGTLLNYYQICHRKLWLFANGISMEHTSATVYDGKLIHQGSYPWSRHQWVELLHVVLLDTDYQSCWRYPRWLSPRSVQPAEAKIQAIVNNL